MVSHIRWGDTVRSPIVPEGKVDVLVAFEILEALRWLDQVRPDGTILVNRQKISRSWSAPGVCGIPGRHRREGRCAGRGPQHLQVPGLDIAQELGNTRALNVVCSGALSGLTDIGPQTWGQVIRQRVPAKVVELNVKAFWRGREALASSRLAPASIPMEVAA